MKSQPRSVLFLLPFLFLGGCDRYVDALSASGPVQPSTNSSSQINAFRGAFEIAYRTVPSIGPGGVPQGAETASSVDANMAYLNAEFSLVDANCLDYFHQEGHLQQTINVFKDLNGVFVPILSGALALTEGSARAGAIVALVGAANNGVLNTVYTDFLFDSSNIDDVQKLTLDALATHTDAVYKNLSQPGTAINFNWVTGQIYSHQSMCQPAHILALVRQAISKSTLISRNVGVPNTSPFTGGQHPMFISPSNGQVINVLPPPTAQVDVEVASGDYNADTQGQSDDSVTQRSLETV